MSVFIIAEAGSTWRQVRTPEQLEGTGIGAEGYLATARRSIQAAKECGADAWKAQWTSNAEKMAARRGNPEWAAGYKKWLQYPAELLPALKSLCDNAGLEFMCTVYLIEDIAVIAPLVKRFKVSAYEATWAEFAYAHKEYGKPVIISKNPGQHLPDNTYWADVLHCVSKYPTPLESLGLRNGMQESNCVEGFSDHTANVLTGAAAVAAGASIVEAHIKLEDTSKDNPDYPHSLFADGVKGLIGFAEYVRNIRTVERML